jgi:uncharacterized protein (TIGR00251 family)
MVEKTIINVHIITGSKEFKIEFVEWLNVFKIKLKSKAVKGKANKELIERLEKIFNSKVKIVSGIKNSKKKLLIEGKSFKEIMARLNSSN